MDAPLSDRRAPLLLGALAAVLLSCGPTAGQPDPFRGAVYPGGLDAKFLPVSSGCPTGISPCYLAQEGYLKDAPYYFFNFGPVTTSMLGYPKTPASVASAIAYDFPPGCSPVQVDPLNDAYARDKQYSVFSAIPLATTNKNVAVLPLVAVGQVTGVSGETCNDIKTAASIGTTSIPGNFGAVGTKTATVALRPVVDDTAFFVTKGNPVTLTQAFGWYDDLELLYLDAGPIPPDGSGGLLAQDGVVVDPMEPKLNAKVTDAQAVILQYGPGDPGYSPMVRLWDFHPPALADGGAPPLGTYNGICHSNSGTCGATEVDMDSLKVGSATPYNTIFVVPSP